MSVLLPNTRLGVRHRLNAPETNSHGERMQAGWGNIEALLPGRTKQNADGTWALGVDPELWPVRAEDLVISETGESWLVQTSALLTNNHDSTVDWVRVQGLHRGNGGTEPGGAWFVARYTDHVTPAPPGDDPVSPQPGLWTGNGPPPIYDFGANPGDEYIDLVSGVVYELGAT